MRLDKRMRKFGHYASRYEEHKRSANLDHTRLKEFEDQIKFIINKSGNKYTKQDFSFIEEIMVVVVRARRAVANSYPYRFFMRGKNKKKFFDGLQEYLELNVEKLSGTILVDLTSFITVKNDGCKFPQFHNPFPL